MTDSDPDPDPTVMVCQGAPRCNLEGDQAFQAQLNGCVWCKLIICHASGNETIIEPGEA